MSHQDEIRRRVMLEFDESVALKREELRRSWYLIDPSLTYVSDLSYDISSEYKLKQSCPNGLSLFLKEFNLPRTQSLSLLRDGDHVRVFASKEGSDKTATRSRKRKRALVHTGSKVLGKVIAKIGRKRKRGNAISKQSAKARPSLVRKSATVSSVEASSSDDDDEEDSDDSESDSDDSSSSSPSADDSSSSSDDDSSSSDDDSDEDSSSDEHDSGSDESSSDESSSDESSSDGSSSDESSVDDKADTAAASSKSSIGSSGGSCAGSGSSHVMKDGSIVEKVVFDQNGNSATVIQSEVFLYDDGCDYGDNNDNQEGGKRRRRRRRRRSGAAASESTGNGAGNASEETKTTSEAAPTSSNAPSIKKPTKKNNEPLDYSSFPSVVYPQAGQLVAFQALTLCTSWNPVVSDFMEARVVRVEGTRLTVQPVFGFPRDANEEDEAEGFVYRGGEPIEEEEDYDDGYYYEPPVILPPSRTECAKMEPREYDTSELFNLCAVPE